MILIIHMKLPFEVHYQYVLIVGHMVFFLFYQSLELSEGPPIVS